MFHRSFTDFDEFASQAQHWDLDLQQLDSGPFRAEHSQLGVGDAQITEAKFDRTIRQRGAPPRGLRTVVVPAQSDFEFEWRGARIDGNSLMIFPQGSELEAVSKGSFHVFTCSIPAAQFEDAAHSLGLSGLDPLGGEVARCDHTQIEGIRHLLRRLFTGLSGSPCPFGNLELPESIVRQLPRQIVRAVSASRGASACQARSSDRSRILQQAVDYIDQMAANTVSVAEVCDAVQTSSRTLQLAFADRYGVSPKAYIRAIRLNQVRRELRSHDAAKRRIADIANAFGFWHLGQFAADYRRLFGELPSDTLQRNN